MNSTGPDTHGEFFNTVKIYMYIHVLDLDLLNVAPVQRDGQEHCASPITCLHPSIQHGKGTAVGWTFGVPPSCATLASRLESCCSPIDCSPQMILDIPSQCKYPTRHHQLGSVMTRQNESDNRSSNPGKIGNKRNVPSCPTTPCQHAHGPANANTEATVPIYTKAKPSHPVPNTTPARDLPVLCSRSLLCSASWLLT